jgi:tetratricopeptide (TPR) repeat protein
MAMNLLGNGLADAKHWEESLSVQEAELSMHRRLGASEIGILVTQNNLASTYYRVGRLAEALPMYRDVYSGNLKLNGEDDGTTLLAASNYASTLSGLQRFEEAKALFRKTMPVVRRVHGEEHRLTLRMRWNYAEALYQDPGATLDDLREAVTTLEDTERAARRVFGGAHPLTAGIGRELLSARAALLTRETPSPGSA